MNQAKFHRTRFLISAPVAGILAALIFLTAFVAMRGRPAGASDTSVYGDELDRAQTYLDRQDYSNAESLLSDIVLKDGRTTADGAEASYCLAAAYRAQYRYDDALVEAQLLSNVMPNVPTSEDAPSKKDVSSLVDSLQGIVGQISNLQVKVADATDTANRLDATGMLLMAEGQFDAADKSWISSYAALAHEPSLIDADKARIEAHFLMMQPQFMTRDQADRVKGQACLDILGDKAASNDRRVMAIDILIPISYHLTGPPASPTTAVQNRQFSMSAIKGLIVEASDSAFPELRNYASGVLASEARSQMAEAVAAEVAHHWTIAASLYQNYLKVRSPDESGAPYIKQLADEARRSVLVLSVVSRKEASASCSFIGVDHTLGVDWKGRIGQEAWILFALHGGDLCGGPKIVDGSFTYAARNGDPSNQIRRWRDPIGYRAWPGDLFLADPASPSNPAVAFLDDNGEQYSDYGGPDIYMEINVPAGRHILSMPLHFSNPTVQGKPEHNAVYLLTTDRNSINHNSTCATSAILNAADEPGYARFAVLGPAHYTLIVRKLDGYNANLQALFLDPDNRYVVAPALNQEFSKEQLSSDSAASQNLSQLIVRYELQRLGKARVDWSELQKLAFADSNNSNLPTSQRAIAAYINWQALERCPLSSGDSAIAFEGYLKLTFDVPTTGALASALN